jgi:hypothetical protein
METGALRTRPRDEIVREVQRRLEAQGFPRLAVLVILGVSGLAAFLSSVTMVALGLDVMAIRYFTATLAGYLTFLLLIRAWVSWRLRDPGFDVDLPDLTSSSPTSSSPGPFAGGRSGGGGGGVKWDASSSPAPSKGGGFDLGLDDAWPLVLAAVCALGGVIALGYVVYAAPVLLAEVALDAALVTSLYRRLRREDARYWLGSAIRRTWMPAVTAAAFLALALQWAVPDANSIGDVWRLM